MIDSVPSNSKDSNFSDEVRVVEVKAMPLGLKENTNTERELVEVDNELRPPQVQFLGRAPRILPPLQIQTLPVLIINERRVSQELRTETIFPEKAQRQNMLHSPINLEKLESSNIEWDAPFTGTERSHNQSFDGGVMKRKEMISSKNERYNRRKTMTAIPDNVFLPPFKTRQVKIKEFYTMFYVKYISNIYLYRKLMPSWPH